MSTKRLFGAMCDEDLGAFKQVLACGVDVDAFDEEGMTLLVSAADACMARITDLH